MTYVEKMRNRALEDINAYFPYVYESLKIIDGLGFGEWFIETVNGERLIYDEVARTIRRYSVCDDDESRLRKEFGIRLRKMLYFKGVSQEELSEQTGLSKVTLSKYMNGRSIPNYFKAKKIADALECSLDDFSYK